MLDLFSDVKFWGVVISSINLFIVIGGILVGRLAFLKIMNNDLHHVSLDLKAIKDKQKDHDKKFDDQRESIGKIAEKVAFLEGVYNAPRITKRKTVRKANNNKTK